MYLIDKTTCIIDVSKRTEDDNHDAVSAVSKISSEFPSFVRLTQIDRSAHMNNSMYLYELNFSRRHFFNTLGLWLCLKEIGANMVIASQTIRYRREIRALQKYKIVTRIVQISEKESCFFLESRFVTADGFVAAVHCAKYKMVGSRNKARRLSPLQLLKNAGVLHPNCQLRESIEGESGSAEIEFVELWERANAVSSSALNPRKKVLV